MEEDNYSIDQVLLQLHTGLSVFEKQELKTQLTDYINYLLLHDFNKLVQLLYRIDINEQKLKQIVQENPQTDAAILISDLLIQRQEEKIRTRQSFKPSDDITE